MLVNSCPNCAKRLGFKEEQVGKRAKCGGCGEVFLLKPPVTPTQNSFLPVGTGTPAKSQSMAEGVSNSKVTTAKPSSPVNTASPPNVSVGTSDKIDVPCKCGKVLKAPASAQGKAIKCKYCNQVTPIPRLSADKASSKDSLQGANPASGSASPKSVVPKAGLVANPSSQHSAFDDPLFATPTVPNDSLGELPDTSSFQPSNALWGELDSEIAKAQSTPAMNPYGATSNAYSSNPYSAPLGNTKPTKSSEEATPIKTSSRGSAASSILNSIAWSNLMEGDTRVVMFMFGCLLIGPIVAIMGLMSGLEHGRIESEGKFAEGVIVSGEEWRGRKGSRSYNFEIAYVAEDNRPYVKKFSVSYAFFSSHISGDSIVNDAVQVKYLPSSPNSAHLVGEEPSQWTMLYFGIGGLVVGIGIAGYKLFLDD